MTAAHQRPANFALYVYLMIVNTLFSAKQIPLKAALNRRVFGTLNFYNTIGEFHDNIILTIDPTKLSLEYCHQIINDTLQFMDAEGFFLSSIKDLDELRITAGATPFSFNHLGDLNHAEDTLFTKRLRAFPLTYFPSISYSIENKWIRLLLNNGISPGQMSIVHNVLASMKLDFSTTLLTTPDAIIERKSISVKEPISV